MDGKPKEAEGPSPSDDRLATPVSPAPQLIDQAGLAYRTLTPHPFDGSLFLSKLESRFQRKNTRGFSLNAEGTLSTVDRVYLFKNAQLNFDPDTGVIGATGSVYSDVGEAFDIICGILSDELSFDFSETRSLEIVAQGRFRTRILPARRLAEVYQGPVMQGMLAFMDGQGGTPLTVRLGGVAARDTKESFRELRDWWDFRLEPLNLNPSYLYWNLVYRKADSAEVRRFWDSLPSKLDTLIRGLDSS